jgi:hypothetical protein
MSAPRQLTQAKKLMDEGIEVSSTPVYQVLRQARVAARRGLVAPEHNDLQRCHHIQSGYITIGAGPVARLGDLKENMERTFMAATHGREVLFDISARRSA